MNLEDALPDDVKSELNEAAEASEAEKRAAELREKRAATRYGSLLEDDE